MNKVSLRRKIFSDQPYWASITSLYCRNICALPGLQFTRGVRPSSVCFAPCALVIDFQWSRDATGTFLPSWTGGVIIIVLIPKTHYITAHLRLLSGSPWSFTTWKCGGMKQEMKTSSIKKSLIQNWGPGGLSFQQTGLSYQAVWWEQNEKGKERVERNWKMLWHENNLCASENK